MRDANRAFQHSRKLSYLSVIQQLGTESSGFGCSKATPKSLFCHSLNAASITPVPLYMYTPTKMMSSIKYTKIRHKIHFDVTICERITSESVYGILGYAGCSREVSGRKCLSSRLKCVFADSLLCNRLKSINPRFKAHYFDWFWFRRYVAIWKSLIGRKVNRNCTWLMAYHEDIFLNLPCIHTLYIFNCRFRLTRRRRSTPSCSIVNKGGDVRTRCGEQRLGCMDEAWVGRGPPDSFNVAGCEVSEVSGISDGISIWDEYDVEESTSSSVSVSTWVLVVVSWVGNTGDPVNSSASSSSLNRHKYFQSNNIRVPRLSPSSKKYTRVLSPRI